MPVVPNFFERLFFLRLNQAPGPALDLVGAGVFRAVAAALKLGLFDAVNDRPRTAAELSAKISADEAGVTVLLDFLAESRYLKRAGQGYSCTAMTRKWLVRSSPTSIAPFVTFFHNFALPFIDSHLEDSIRLGRPPITLYESLDQTPDGWKNAQEWFLSLARLVSGEIVNKPSCLPRPNACWTLAEAMGSTASNSAGTTQD